MIKLKDMVTRHDKQGSGDWRANRGNRKHQGRDYNATPGQSFPSFISGKVERIAFPYKGDQEYTGVVVSNGQVRCKMFYLQATKKIGEYVRRGEEIGIAQNIAKRYPSKDKPMKPHVHVETYIKHLGIWLLIDPDIIRCV